MSLCQKVKKKRFLYSDLRDNINNNDKVEFIGYEKKKPKREREHQDQTKELCSFSVCVYKYDIHLLVVYKDSVNLLFIKYFETYLWKHYHHQRQQ